MRRAALTLAVAIEIAGCGGADTTTTASGAGGANGAQGSSGSLPASEQPGGPEPNAPTYTALGSWWRKLPQGKRLASASQFIADHPADCAGVDPADLERQTFVAYGYDYPEATQVSAVMLDQCE